MHGLIIQLPARVIVDPNSVSRRHPDLTAASFSDADRIPERGEFVFAVQPDAEDGNYVGSAHVEFLDQEYELIYLRIDWSSFSRDRLSVARRERRAGDRAVVRTEIEVEAALRAEPLLDPYELNQSSSGTGFRIAGHA